MIKDVIGAPDQPFQYTMADGRGRKHVIRVCYKKMATPCGGCKKIRYHVPLEIIKSKEFI